jgi:hypothetical protein
MQTVEAAVTGTFWQRWSFHVKWVGFSLSTSIMLRLVDLGLMTLGYRRLCRLLLRLSPTPNPKRVDLFRARAAAAVVNKVAQQYPKMNCIRRSLVLWWMLRWLGLNSALQIGMNPDNGHAWIEHAGRVINDAADVSTHYAIRYQDELTPEVISKLV